MSHSVFLNNSFCL